MACWLFAAVCLAAMLVGHFGGENGVLVPLGSGGDVVYATYWIGAVGWALSFVVATARGSWKRVIASTVAIAITIVPSIALIAACTGGDCI